MSDSNRLRIHAQITPQTAHEPELKPVRWRSIPHPLQRRRRMSRAQRAKDAPASPKKALTMGDRMLRNSALACALLLAILAMGNINQPWAIRTSETVQRALTMHIDLDESIGRLSFVRNLIPESALVFLNVSGETEFAVPVAGEITHPYSDLQPWLLFACPTSGAVSAIADGTVTAVSELSGDTIGILIDHGNGRESVYAYLSDADVAPGDTVSRGQTLGSTAGQLYFELRENEIAVDPTEKMGL